MLINNQIVNRINSIFDDLLCSWSWSYVELMSMFQRRGYRSEYKPTIPDDLSSRWMEYDERTATTVRSVLTTHKTDMPLIIQIFIIIKSFLGNNLINSSHLTLHFTVQAIYTAVVEQSFDVPVAPLYPGLLVQLSQGGCPVGPSAPCHSEYPLKHTRWTISKETLPLQCRVWQIEENPLVNSNIRPLCSLSRSSNSPVAATIPSSLTHTQPPPPHPPSFYLFYLIRACMTESRGGT